MTSQTTKIDGLPELARKLKKLPDDLRRKELDKAVAAGARIIRNAAKQRAAKRSGVLARNIVVRKEKKKFKRGRDSVYRVGVLHGKGARGGDPYYFRFVEFGTSKMPARPFLRPALHSNGDAAIGAMAAKLRVALQRLAVK